MADTFYITQSQFDQISAAADASVVSGNFADMYQLIYDALLGESAVPDDNGNLVLAEGNVQAWFGAAVEANRGEGAASTLIRVYTQAQIELRSGQPMSDPQGAIQTASNAIARQVFEDIAGASVTIEGQVYYAIPDAFRIGGTDATQAVDNLAGFDLSMWSGNPLFIGLGIEDFWIQNLLGDTSNTYDVLAAIEALRIAGFSTLNQVASVLGQFTSQGSGGIAGAASALSAANAATRTFMDEAYDLGEISLATLSSSNISLGSDNFDGSIESNGFSSDTFMHGGSGNDALIGSLGTDILDGGAGNDSVSFEDVSQFGGPQTLDLTASIYSRSSDVQFAATVLGQGIVSQIYDVENLALGLGDDVLEIQRLTADNTSLNRIIGSDNGQRGDTIDFSNANAAATASLADGTVSLSGSGTTLEVFEFENLVGSAYRDILEGDDTEGGNRIEGGGGKDDIEGKGGDDYLRGGNGWDKVDGGADDDIIEAGNGGDRSFGGDGDDLIFTNAYNRNAFYSGEDKVWGGAGNDVIIGDDGVDIIYGGAQHDLIIGGGGADKLNGQWGNDYIIVDGADEVRGGGGRDWINATAEGADATIFFGADDGHDHIQKAADGSGVQKIVFEGLASTDVTLHWDIDSALLIDTGETMIRNWWGDAYIEVNATGATINLGGISGTWIEQDNPPGSDDGNVTFLTNISLTASLDDNYELVFTDVSSSQLPRPGQIINYQIFSANLFDDYDNGIFSRTSINPGAGEFQPDPGLVNPNRFLSNFDNGFVGDESVLLNGTTDIASILSEDTLMMLTEDVFALA
jgi:Ca2+-binding RTX toxin-like protein